MFAVALQPPLCPRVRTSPPRRGRGVFAARLRFISQASAKRDVVVEAFPLAPVSPLAGEMSASADRGGGGPFFRNAGFAAEAVSPPLSPMETSPPLGGRWVGAARFRSARPLHFDLMPSDFRKHTSKLFVLSGFRILPSPALRGRCQRQLTEGGIAMPHQDVPPWQREKARRLRRDMTEAERRLWRAIRAHRLEGIAFRRQMPIGRYITDFAAPDHRLIVELDGSQHGDRRLAHDGVRDAFLKSSGWTVLRFWNADVMTDLDGVCRRILDVCHGGKIVHE